MKWLVVAVILSYLGLRIYVYFKPRSALARAVRRRFLLRTDAHAMTTKELLLSALSFFTFAAACGGVYLGVTRGADTLGWAFFDARPVVVLAKAGLFVGAMALATGLLLVGAATLRRGRGSGSRP